MSHPSAPQENKPLQPATAIVSNHVRPDKLGEYRQAQAVITEAARKFPGFVGTEVLSPVAGLQEEWVVIFRLESNQAMKRWLDSPERQHLTAQIQGCLADPSRLQVLAGNDQAEPPVAMVFTHRVRKEKESEYRAWRRKTIITQAKYPGYLATEFFEPRGRFQDKWVDIVRYDTVDHLDNWLKSRARQELLAELAPLVESVHEHRMTGLEGWFTFGRRSDEAPHDTPPAWKQALTVLLALYPTVMLLGILMNPFMRHLPFAVQMLIGNICSIALLTWLIMPQVSRWLGFWLVLPANGTASEDRWRREATGLGIVVVSITLLVLVFWAVG